MDILSTVLILIGLVAGIIMLLREQRKNPGIQLSDIVLKSFRNRFTGWFLVILAVATLAECLVAATTHSVTQVGEINQVGRILAHIVLGVFQFISGIAISSSVQTVFSSIKARRIRPMIIYALQSAILLFGVFYAPVMNLTIMASSLQQIRELNLFLFSLWEMVPFSGVGEHQIRVRALKLGFDQTAVPFELLSSNIILLLSTIGVHMLVSSVEILHLLGTDHTSQIGVPGVSDNKDDKKEDDDKKEEDDKKGADEEIFATLVSRLGMSPMHSNRVVKAAIKEATQLSAAEDSEKLVGLMERCHVLETSTDKESEDHIEDIEDLFFSEEGWGLTDPRKK